MAKSSTVFSLLVMFFGEGHKLNPLILQNERKAKTEITLPSGRLEKDNADGQSILTGCILCSSPRSQMQCETLVALRQKSPSQIVIVERTLS